MTLRLDISPNWFRAGIVTVFALTVWVGIVLGNFLGPPYFLGFVGGFWASLGVTIHFGWLRFELRCKGCKGMASLETKYREGPAGSKTYPVLVCPHCRKEEIV